MNTIHKILGATTLLMTMGAASASPFYIDNGVNFQPDTSIPTKVNATSTSIKNELTVKYQSSTNITFGADGILSVGDAIATSGGLAVGNISENAVTSLNPGQGIFGNGFADNGLDINWSLSFSFTDLTGTVTGFDSSVPTFPLVHYTGGTINFLYTTDGSTFNNFMDLLVTDSTSIGPNLSVTGNIDFTSVTNLDNVELFHTADGVSFYDAWLAGGVNALSFIIDQNTNPNVATFAPIFSGTDLVGANIQTNHDGSVTFAAVPEPVTLAMLGLGLMGFSAFSRRKKSA
ncbi:MAG: PEP-CTERM sorting domain-containing protein [Methylococcaceae bacterium]|nr:PEP-CTERM sorting domain-containing protein [Methylococcaceae bacterium]